MPWHITDDHPDCSGWAVVKDDDNSVAGCHDTKADAEKQMAALYANEDGRMDAPREDLIRMATQLRHDDEGNTLVGYAAVFNESTEINSWEGRFKETILPGAFKNTLKQRGGKIKVLFNHGMDPSIGDKPLGKPRAMREDRTGLWVEVPLDDTSYNRDIKALLKSGALDGMSIRMSVVREDWDKLDTDLPERSIKEIRLLELGPVTFPAYEATEAGVRAHAPKAFEAWRSAHPDTQDSPAEEREEEPPEPGHSDDAPPDSGHPSHQLRPTSDRNLEYQVFRDAADASNRRAAQYPELLKETV